MQPQPHPELARAFALSEQGRNDEAVAIIRDLAGRGDAEAMFVLADMHWRDEGDAGNLALGREWFRRASEAGHPIARRAYTNLLANGVAGPRDWSQAMARLREEARGDARRGDMLALIEAMDLTPTGFVGRPPQGERLHDRPEITIFRNLFTPAECDFLMTVAEPGFVGSTVVLSSGETAPDPIRTSEDSTMHWLIEDPAIHALNRRLAAASGTLYEQGEPLLILRYRPGQQYRKHCDAIPGETNQRFKTALVYLNEDYEGGETEFSRIGVKVRGQRGDGVVFANTLDGHRVDPLSEHAGLPVISGTKYLASRWIRGARHLPRVG